MPNLKDIKNILVSVSNELQANSVQHWPVTKNGPYEDLETPLRTLSHLLKINAYLYKSTNEGKYKDRAEKLLILAKSLTEDFTTLIFRVKEGKDSSNGLIGPAWLLEGLLHAYKNIGDDEYKISAKKVYSLFRFDVKHLVWSFPDNGAYSLDPTFNHQLWFAAQALKLGCKNAKLFLEHFIPRMKVNDGVIFHLTPLRTDISMEGARQYVRFLKYKKLLSEKSKAYNAFNLLALSECFLVDKNLSAWGSKNFKKLFDVDISPEFFNVIKKSKYGMAYNPQAPAYIIFGELFQEHIKNNYITQHEVCFSNFLTHEIKEHDNLLKIRNYEYITLLEFLNA
jgi:hypothetical protein